MTKQSLFALSIIAEGKTFQFKSKMNNFNIFEVVALLRRYCDEIEKKVLDDKFKNIKMEFGDKDGNNEI